MIKVLQNGVQNSVQDMGRFGYAKFGIPTSGVMDATSFLLGNQLLGNHPNDACIEVAFGMIKLEFLAATQICITGANYGPKINDEAIELKQVYAVQKGAILSFGKKQFGVYTNIHVKGGVQTEVVLGSRSYYPNITKTSKIFKNDCLPIADFDEVTYITNGNIQQKKTIDSLKLTCYKGPEFKLLSNHQQEILSQKFTITNHCNRIGFVIQEKLSNNLPSLLTSAVLPGTVQLTPDGSLIILHRDCQTTGGYPRVLQLAEESLPILSQKFGGDSINFEIIE